MARTSDRPQTYNDAMEMAHSGEGGNNTVRILMIDDDEKLGHLLQDYLQPQGYVLDLSLDGKDGLYRALNQKYDAILLDVMLPGMNGYDVLREIRKQSSVPVLMLTALGDEMDRVAGLDVGADDYLPKTFSTTELSARLRAVLRRSFTTSDQSRRFAQERLDLEEAREIQKGLLPKSFPELPGIEISGAWIPARAVSGDYYDAFRLSTDKIAICIGDVSGKGAPAALLMANVQAAVRAFAAAERSPAELCASVNGILCSNLAEGRYVTFFYGVIDGKTRRLVYTCAGHNAPGLVRSDGAATRLSGGGTVLGLFPSSRYENVEIQLLGGDRLLLFTDGLTEAVNSSGEEFGEERLFQIARTLNEMDAVELQQNLINAVTEFSGGAVDDDVTLLVVRIANER